MKKNRNRSVLLLTVLTMITMLTVAAFTVYAKEVKPKKITRVGTASRTVVEGQEFELKVKSSPWNADDDYLRWKIVSGKNVIRFDDYDTWDDEADFRALKAGTAKVCCYIQGKKKATKINFTVNVQEAAAGTQTISRVGRETQYVGLYDDVELEVRKSSGLSENQLEWSIADTSILRFEERIHTGHEMDFEGIKTGTTTVTCKIKGTDEKVTFTVKVLPYYDD